MKIVIGDTVIDTGLLYRVDKYVYYSSNAFVIRLFFIGKDSIDFDFFHRYFEDNFAEKCMKGEAHFWSDPKVILEKKRCDAVYEFIMKHWAKQTDIPSLDIESIQ